MIAIPGRAVLLVELDGVLHQVTLSQDRMQILLQLAVSLSDDGKLPVMKAAGITFGKQEAPNGQDES